MQVNLLDVLNNPVVGEAALALLEAPEVAEKVAELSDEILGLVDTRYTAAEAIIACITAIEIMSEMIMKQARGDVC